MNNKVKLYYKINNEALLLKKFSQENPCPRLAPTLYVSWQSSFYRAMLCISGTNHGPVSVCPSVRPSQVGVLLKWLNVKSHKQHHTIVQGL